MDPITRRQALRIASKVTLTFSMIACGASIGTEDTDYSEGSSEEAIKRKRKADAGTDCGKDALADGSQVKESNTPDAKKAACKPVVNEDMFSPNDSPAAKEGRACCRAKLTGDLAKGIGIEDTEENYACCENVSYTFWGGAEEETGTNAAQIQQENNAMRLACCDTYGWSAPMINPDGGPSKRIIACTPWGPPVPPSMKIARKRFRKNTHQAMNGVA